MVVITRMRTDSVRTHVFYLSLLVCDYLLVRYSNICSILHRFRDIAAFAGFCADDPPPIPHVRSVLVALDRPRWGQSEQVP